MDMKSMMRQAEKMQAQMAKVQVELDAERVEASSGGGMVTVVASGSGAIISIRIDPSAIDPEDAEMLEDMVLAAVNEACRMAGELANRRMSAVTGGMGLPGM